MKTRQDPSVYWYLHINGTLIKKTALHGIRGDLDESDFVVKWWIVVNKDDMTVMLHDMKTNYIDRVKSINDFNRFCSKAEDVWGITSADYFRHAVKEAAKEGV